MSFDFCELFLFCLNRTLPFLFPAFCFKQGPGFYRLCRKHMHKDSALANVEVFCLGQSGSIFEGKPLVVLRWVYVVDDMSTLWRFGGLLP